MGKPISNRALKKLKRQMEKRINPRKNEYGKTDLTPYNVCRNDIEKIVYK